MCMIGSLKYQRNLYKHQGIVAYRAFARQGDNKLSAIFAHYDYHMGNEFSTKMGSTTSGFYAYKSVTGLRQHRYCLLARVILWGTVYVHEKGYRASNMQIKRMVRQESYIYAPSQPKYIQELAQFHDMPIMQFDYRTEWRKVSRTLMNKNGFDAY